jgi:GlcNAc-P-P-Und epimerase
MDKKKERQNLDNLIKERIVITGGSGFIGTNLVEFYLAKGWDVLNIDSQSPRNPNHFPVWRNLDILNFDNLLETIHDFQPTYLLHFAARTDLNEKDNLAGYSSNINGVQNVVEAIKKTPSIKRVIFCSSQLVCKVGYLPKNEFDYCPNTLYGKSKVQSEIIIRSANDLDTVWTILRPTSIWGPWFDVPYKGFFETIKKGMYLHPSGITTFKQWGFVGNSIFQIDELLNAPEEKIDKEVFYLADYEPLRLEDFANLVQKEMHGPKIRKVPPFFFKFAAFVGDLLQILGWKNPPLTTFRYNNIIVPELEDLKPLQSIVGPLPFSTKEGIALTVAWMEEKDHSIK